VQAAANGGPFIVVGGGIGGLAAAYALALKGFPVRLFEQAGEFREVGAGIQLGPNVFRALDRLGLKDVVLDDAWQPGAQEMRCALSGKIITHIPLGDPFLERFKQPYGVTHRHDLHVALLNACRSHPLIALNLWQRVIGFVDGGDLVEVALENVETNERSSVKGRALIGADGVWSAIRQRVVGDGKPRVSGHIAYRAVLKRSDVPEDLWRPDVILWAGPRTHFVHYPLRRGELYNLVAVFHSDRYEEGWNASADPGLLWQHFNGQRPEVLRLLERIETWRMWVLCDREPVKQWSKGRATLLGDAAHPMLQYLAQGANMAIEDAVRLADEVERCPDDLSAAFQAYQEARYLRTGRLQILSRVYGQFYHASGVTAELRDQMLGARTPQDAYDGVAWLYGGNP
jgi:3-hydroxybenzoate 6-monooxygenase